MASLFDFIGHIGLVSLHIVLRHCFSSHYFDLFSAFIFLNFCLFNMLNFVSFCAFSNKLSFVLSS